MEGPDERGGISPVPGSNRVTQTPFGFRGALCCDGQTVNRRTVSLSDKPVDCDRRRYDDRCARIPSRPGANGFHEQAGYITATVFAITSKCDLQRRGRPYIYRELRVGSAEAPAIRHYGLDRWLPCQAPITIAQFETRSNVTLCARRFGVAVRLASTHERDCEDGTASSSGVAHQSGRRRARSGSVKPRRASICAKVRTTVSAKRLSRYWYSDRYSDTDDGDEGAVVIASQEYLGRLTVSCAVLHAEHPFVRDIRPMGNLDVARHCGVLSTIYGELPLTRDQPPARPIAVVRVDHQLRIVSVSKRRRRWRTGSGFRRRVLDFGLAKALDETGGCGTAVPSGRRLTRRRSPRAR